MTVSSTSSKAVGRGNGATTGFTYSFLIPTASDVRVTYVDASGNETVLSTSQYTISGLGADAGGTVTYPLSGSAIASGTSLLIERILPLTQLTELENQGGYFPSSVESALDRVVMMIQQLQDGDSGYEQALKFPGVDVAPTTFLPPAAARANKYLAFDLQGNPAMLAGTSSGVDVSANTASATHGTASATLAKRFDTHLDAKLDFGCKGDGTTNDTVNMLAFFNACIANQVCGFIPAGTYVITEGQLAFDTNFLDKAFPIIQTAGYDVVTFKAAGLANSPIIALTNGTASSGVGAYWRGGYLGGITFLDSTGATASSRCAIKLRGVWAMRFGWMVGSGLRGDLLLIEGVLFGGTNPDPYAVTFCEFAGIEANNCVGAALNNQNYVGLNGCTFHAVRAVGGGNGVVGLGAGNRFISLSLANITPGWAVDDGITNTGGTSTRNFIGEAEIDNCQNGVRLNFTQLTDFRGTRFVHRYNTTPNASGNYWPRACFDMASAGSPNVSMVNAQLWHRIEAGGVKANLGTFVDGHSNGNISGVAIDQKLSDNAGLGLVDTDLYTGITTTPTLVIRRDGKPIGDTRTRVASVVTSSTAQSVPNAGYGTAAAKLVFPTKRYDAGGYYDTSNNWFVVPYTGEYRMTAMFHINVAAATRVRYGMWRDRAGALDALLAKVQYSSGGGDQGYEVNGVFDLTAGDRIFLMAEQNTAGSVSLTAPTSNASNNIWSIEALGGV